MKKYNAAIAVKQPQVPYNDQLMDFAPIADRVLVRRVQAPDVSHGGIIIPDNSKDRPQEGSILAVGDGKTENGSIVPLRLKVGDRILFGKYSGCEIRLNDEELIIMREEEIMGVLTPRK